MTPERLTLSEKRLAEILDYRFAIFEQEIREHFITEPRAREIARDEFGVASRVAWDTRAKLATVAMLCVAISTFLLTAFRG